MYTVTALYHFAPFPNFKDYQKPILEIAQKNQMCGSLLIAHEGVNGTLAGPTKEGVVEFLNFLKSIPGFKNLEHKESTADEKPFLRLKIRLKKEIVTLGIPEVDPTKTVGTYVDPKDWNALLNDPDAVVVDTRNEYEYHMGTFKGALNPHIDIFKDFPKYVKENLSDKKDKKIVMFCTGGIRCEKASSYMLLEGYDKVYHLKGGILKYLENVAPQESLWEGDCFVFDRRVGLSHGLETSKMELCYGCRMPISPEMKEHEDYEEGVQCPLCAPTLSEEKEKDLKTENFKSIWVKKGVITT